MYYLGCCENKIKKHIELQQQFDVRQMASWWGRAGEL